MKPSEVVKELAAMASSGKYDNVTPEKARRMNELFVETARLINSMERIEKGEVSELDRIQHDLQGDI